MCCGLCNCGDTEAIKHEGGVEAPGGGCGCCQKSVATRDIGAEKCCGCCFADGGSAEAMQLAEPAMVIGAVAAVGLATWVCTKKCKRNTDGHAPVKVPPQQEEMAFLE